MGDTTSRCRVRARHRRTPDPKPRYAASLISLRAALTQSHLTPDDSAANRDGPKVAFKVEPSVSDIYWVLSQETQRVHHYGSIRPDLTAGSANLSNLRLILLTAYLSRELR